MKTLIIIAVVLASPLVARAQNVNVAAVANDSNLMTVTTGIEYGFVASVGYTRALRVQDRQLLVGGEASLAWAEADPSDFQLSAGARMPIVDGSRWKLLGGLAAVVRGTDNDLGRFTTIAGDAALIGGRYARRGFVAAELGIDTALTTHITPSEMYRMTVFPGAKSGWYGETGSMVRAGLQGGVSFARYDIVLRAGRLLDTAGQAALMPIYGTLALDARW
ncbi:MAG TPA: hypothetical protein VL326_31825 [Kofleriaceae bacterium]|nr:hypothetical protein [Kofleriaceae bacterium]